MKRRVVFVCPVIAAGARWPKRKTYAAGGLGMVSEQLNSPSTEEVASFDLFIACMERPEYDVVVFDAAPTGPTLRMLELPVDWSRHISQAEQGTGQPAGGRPGTL